MYSPLLWQAVVQAQTTIMRYATPALGNSTTATPAMTSGKTTAASTQLGPTLTFIGERLCPSSSALGILCLGRSSRSARTLQVT